MKHSCTHVKESFLADVFGSADGRRGHHDRLHLRQVNVASTVRVFAGVVIPQLWGRRRYTCGPSPWLLKRGPYRLT